MHKYQGKLWFRRSHAASAKEVSGVLRNGEESGRARAVEGMGRVLGDVALTGGQILKSFRVHFK